MSVKHVEMPTKEIGYAASDIMEACSKLPSLCAMDDGELVVIYAYVLGVVMSVAGVNLAPLSVASITRIVTLGYDTWATMGRENRVKESG